MNAAPVSAGEAIGSMIYINTSVVVALLTPEERSPQALDWLAQCREPLVSSDWAHAN